MAAGAVAVGTLTPPSTVKQEWLLCIRESSEIVMDAASLKVNQSGTKESEDDTSSRQHFAQECNVSASRIYCHCHVAMPRMIR